MQSQATMMQSMSRMRSQISPVTMSVMTSKVPPQASKMPQQQLSKSIFPQQSEKFLEEEQIGTLEETDEQQGQKCCPCCGFYCIPYYALVTRTVNDSKPMIPIKPSTCEITPLMDRPDLPEFFKKVIEKSTMTPEEKERQYFNRILDEELKTENEAKEKIRMDKKMKKAQLIALQAAQKRVVFVEKNARYTGPNCYPTDIYKTQPVPESMYVYKPKKESKFINNLNVELKRSEDIRKQAVREECRKQNKYLAPPNVERIQTVDEVSKKKKEKEEEKQKSEEKPEAKEEAPKKDDDPDDPHAIKKTHWKEMGAKKEKKIDFEGDDDGQPHKVKEVDEEGKPVKAKKVGLASAEAITM